MNASSRMCRCKYLIRLLSPVLVRGKLCAEGREEGLGLGLVHPPIEFEREKDSREVVRMCEAIRWNKRDPLGGARFMEGFNLKNLWFSLMEYA